MLEWFEISNAELSQMQIISSLHACILSTRFSAHIVTISDITKDLKMNNSRHCVTGLQACTFFFFAETH